MAVLPDTDRQRVQRGVMRYLSGLRQPLALTKADLQAAVNATDAWIDTNAGAYNTALPVAARTNLTATQKTLLFCVVAAMRVSPAFARALLGEVD
jgi:hypothetical protein